MVSVYFKFRPGDVESRSMGAGGIDVMLSPYARDKFPVSIECKNTVGHPSMKAIKQAEANAYKDTYAVVVWKAKGEEYKDSLVTLSFAKFMEIIGRMERY